MVGTTSEDSGDGATDTAHNNNPNENNNERGEEEEKKETIVVSNKKENLQAVLTCSICHQIFRNPHRTPCMHAFCLECINPIIIHSGVNTPCPLCRTIPITPLKRDFLLEQLKSELSSNHYIEDDNVASAADSIYSPPVSPVYTQFIAPAAPPVYPLANPILVQPAQVHELPRRWPAIIDEIMQRPSISIHRCAHSTRRNYIKRVANATLWLFMMIGTNTFKWLAYVRAVELNQEYDAGELAWDPTKTRITYLVFAIFTSLCALFAMSNVFPIHIAYYPNGVLKVSNLPMWKTPFLLLKEVFSRDGIHMSKISYATSWSEQVGRDTLNAMVAGVPLIVLNSVLIAHGAPSYQFIVALCFDVLGFFAFFYGTEQFTAAMFVMLYKGIIATHGAPRELYRHITTLHGTGDWKDWQKIAANKQGQKYNTTHEREGMKLLSDPTNGAGSDLLAAILILLYAMEVTHRNPFYFDPERICTLYDQQLAREADNV